MVHAGAAVSRMAIGHARNHRPGAHARTGAIALPRLRRARPPGLPRDANGFVRSGRDGSVPGAPDVWAIGDGAGFPVKQGWIACEQADSVASSLTRGLVVVADEIPSEPSCGRRSSTASRRPRSGPTGAPSGRARPGPASRH
jgi:hypothetical protein